MPRAKKVPEAEAPQAEAPRHPVSGLTKDEEQKIVDTIMAPTRKTTETNAFAKEDENCRLASQPNKRYLVVALKGERYRIVNKFRQWVSPALSLFEANKLCADLNMKDPEQRQVNKGTGVWHEEDVKPYSE